jgi:hypothetical protein
MLFQLNEEVMVTSVQRGLVRAQGDAQLVQQLVNQAAAGRVIPAAIQANIDAVLMAPRQIMVELDHIKNNANQGNLVRAQIHTSNGQGISFHAHTLVDSIRLALDPVFAARREADRNMMPPPPARMIIPLMRTGKKSKKHSSHKHSSHKYSSHKHSPHRHSAHRHSAHRHSQ